MGRMIAFDPSTRFTGWAAFTRGLLWDCGLIKAKGFDEMLDRTKSFCSQGSTLYQGSLGSNSFAIIEKPQIYTRIKAKGDPNQMILLALIAGHIGALFNKREFITPNHWKGSVDKEVMCARVRSRWMNDDERALLAAKRIPKSYINNTLDAIGIGLHHLGRNR